MLEAFAAEAAVALRQERLSEEAEQAKPLAEADKMRTALLAAVSHDLRTPLASAKAAVESLRNTDIAWSPEDRRELLATAEESLVKLDRLVANLLDMSRLQAGVLGLQPQPTGVEEIVPRAIDDLGHLAERIEGTSPSSCPRSSPIRRCWSGSWSTSCPTRSGTARPARRSSSPPAGTATTSRSASSTAAPASPGGARPRLPAVPAARRP